MAGGVGELWHQGFGADAPVDWDKVAASAAGGGVSGVIAGATLGIGTIAEATGGAALASAVVVNGSANMVGNAVTRGLNGDGSVNGTQIAIDGAVGAAGGAIGHGAAKMLKGELPALAKQVETSQQAARHGGGYGAAQSARGATAKIARINTNANVVNTVAGAKVTNVVAPKAQQVIKDKLKETP